MADHEYDFTDKKQTVIYCRLHDNEKILLKPQEKEDVLRTIIAAGEWVGPDVGIEEGKAMSDEHTDTALHVPATTQQVPTVRPPSSPDMITYESFAGQQVELSVKMVQQMLCQNANEAQARYMLSWCAHNRVDPFGMEAYFSIIDNKPVIQVSKDCWHRRMEGHPAFDNIKSGVRVDTTMEVLKEALLAYEEKDYPYHVSHLLKDKLAKDIEEGHASAPKGLPARITTKKDGFDLDPRENLIGGWARITRKDRPAPYDFDPDVEGWKMLTREGKDNTFWSRKPAFMIWKTARKNCVRLAFPELSGLLNQPELREDDIELLPDEEGAWQSDHDIRGVGNRKMHKLAHQIPPPVGPLSHEHLHTLSAILYGVDSMSELTSENISGMCATLQAACDGDQDILRCIGEDLGRITHTEQGEQDEQTTNIAESTANLANDSIDFAESA